MVDGPADGDRASPSTVSPHQARPGPRGHAAAQHLGAVRGRRQGDPDKAVDPLSRQSGRAAPAWSLSEDREKELQDAPHSAGAGRERAVRRDR